MMIFGKTANLLNEIQYARRKSGISTNFLVFRLSILQKAYSVTDRYTINLGTLISGNILLSSLVHAMPPGREKVSVGWSETVY